MPVGLGSEVPEVYMMKSLSSLSINSAGHQSLCFFIAWKRVQVNKKSHNIIFIHTCEDIPYYVGQ